MYPPIDMMEHLHDILHHTLDNLSSDQELEICMTNMSVQVVVMVVE
tara:strand:- start:124 stop:261 length:138 start_codon:yes stop_codon:yes gene_type:complete